MGVSERGIGDRILTFVGLVFGLIVATSLLPLSALAHVGVVWQSIGGASFVLIYAALGWLVYRLLRKEGIRLRPLPARRFGYVIGVWLILLVLSVSITALNAHLTGTVSSENQAAVDQFLVHLSPAMITMVIYGTLLAPVVEEMIFRGIVMRYFFPKSWWWANIVLSGVLFAWPHMGFMLPTDLANGLNFLLYASMGMVLAYVYKTTGNLTYSIAIHALNNGVTMVPILLLALQRGY